MTSGEDRAKQGEVKEPKGGAVPPHCGSQAELDEMAERLIRLVESSAPIAVIRAWVIALKNEGIRRGSNRSTP